LTGLLRRGACRLRGTFIGGLAAEQSRLRDKLRARKRTQTTLVDGRAVGFLDPGSIPGASTIPDAPGGIGQVKVLPGVAAFATAVI